MSRDEAIARVIEAVESLAETTALAIIYNREDDADSAAAVARDAMNIRAELRKALGELMASVAA